ncbi:acyltransferase [Mycetocola manganoxydans]|uniref:Acyltransferase n=1 Tax=Mycetocola manganoxydans TaxID=699879 RepID=A0A3L6ZS98_9MICO|nr:acyltransferase [Mycetocola manganoxydans]RLP70689.1 acyltransferase [Mycetocola manganoxydans]GHD48859.1 hypothetical protein GCM10008097_21310 [Mycetocola manganoxydans]
MSGRGIDTPGRIDAVDIARGLAILGMFAAHAMPRADESELLVDGRSSILFATLAGVSLGLLSGGSDPPARGSRGRIVQVVLIRALFVFLLGLLLWTLGSEIAIILDYYAVMFLLVLPLLFASRAVLAGVAVLVLFGAPVLADAVDAGERAPASVPEVLREYLLTGSYPALVWMPLLLAGLIAARSGLNRRRTQIWLLAGGATAAGAGYGGAALIIGVTATAHSGSTAEILGSGGLALALLGFLLLITSEGPFAGVVRTVLWPVGSAGALALTVYTAQIVVLAMAAGARDSGGPGYPGWPLLIGLTVASLVGASVWRAVAGRGPLERVLALAAGRR